MCRRHSIYRVLTFCLLMTYDIITKLKIIIKSPAVTKGTTTCDVTLNRHEAAGAVSTIDKTEVRWSTRYAVIPTV